MCERDLEGIVGKWARGSYSTGGRTTSWVKIKNPALDEHVRLLWAAAESVAIGYGGDALVSAATG